MKNIIRILIATLMISLLAFGNSSYLVSGADERSGLIDNVNISCRGPFLFQILVRESVFSVSFNQTSSETVEISMDVNVTKKDGELLFETLTPFVVDLQPNHSFHMGFWTFPDFRKAHHLFGFFDVNVDFTVLTDGSHKIERFRGFIFGISAIILDKEGKIIE